MYDEKFIAALRKHYGLPSYMLDADVIQSCEGLGGWYWVKIRLWFGRNWRKVGWILLAVATGTLWLLIAHLSLEELAR